MLCHMQSVESGKVVLDGGYVDLDPAKLAASVSTAAPNTTVGCHTHSDTHTHSCIIIILCIVCV